MPKSPAQFEKIRTDRKAAILDAALHVFAEEGYHSASISKVSKYAGVSKGLMYNYFSSKEELLDQLIGDLLDEEIKIAIEIVKEEFTSETFKKFIKYTVEALKAKPKLWKLYFSLGTQSEITSIVEKRFAKEQIEIQQKLLTFFTEQGHEDPSLQLQFFYTTFGGLKVSYIMHPETYPIEKIETLIIKHFIQL